MVQTNQQNLDLLNEVIGEWQALFTELNRLETYLSLLDEQYSQIIKSVFFEKKTRRTIEEETGLSRRTINRRKKEAIDILVDMYSFTGKLIE